jgi:glyoxylase-like metal-dependent hydrolase (beta-lactamase superfamily II)
MRKIRKRLLVGMAVIGRTVVLLVSVAIGLYVYITKPLEDGARLASGAVTTVVTGRFGPVAIAAYVFELNEGGVGLVDAGSDREAVAIRTALTRLGMTPADVRVILVTHAHNDHAAGTLAFANATVYTLEPDAAVIRRQRARAGAIAMTQGLESDEQLDLFGDSG